MGRLFQSGRSSCRRASADIPVANPFNIPWYCGTLPQFSCCQLASEGRLLPQPAVAGVKQARFAKWFVAFFSAGSLLLALSGNVRQKLKSGNEYPKKVDLGSPLTKCRQINKKMERLRTKTRRMAAFLCNRRQYSSGIRRAERIRGSFKNRQ